MKCGYILKIGGKRKEEGPCGEEVKNEKSVIIVEGKSIHICRKCKNKNKKLKEQQEKEKKKEDELKQLNEKIHQNCCCQTRLEHLENPEKKIDRQLELQVMLILIASFNLFPLNKNNKKYYNNIDSLLDVPMGEMVKCIQSIFDKPSNRKFFVAKTSTFFNNIFNFVLNYFI